MNRFPEVALGNTFLELAPGKQSILYCRVSHTDLLQIGDGFGAVGFNRRFTGHGSDIGSSNTGYEPRGIEHVAQIRSF